MSILEAVLASSTDIVQACGLHFKIKKVSSADLVGVGFAWLAMAMPDNGEVNEQDLAAALSRMPKDKIVEMAKLKDAMIAAGLVAIGKSIEDSDEIEWDQVQITLKRSEENVKDGKLWVGTLPADVDNVLFQAIMSLSTDGGTASDKIASFRGPARNARSTRRRGKKVQRTASPGS
jgi:translation elongation factor EF-1beta